MSSLKSPMGSVLIKFRNPAVSLEHTDRPIAQMLQARGLLDFRQTERLRTTGEFVLNAPAHWILTGRGEEFLATHSDDQLLSGRFRFTDDHAWYDRQPWKLILPAVISFLTTVLTMAVGHWLKWK